MIGIILAAGDGTRLKNSAGEECCKVLQKVNNTHLIEFALNNLVALNVTNALVVVGKYGDQIKSVIGDVYKGLKITYVYQSHQIGLINAFVQALKQMRDMDDVILQLADEIFVDYKAENVKKLINENEYDFYCGVTYETNCEKIKANYAVETDENFFIKKCTEKPAVVENNIKGTGFCVFKGKALQYLKNSYNETDNIPNNLCDYMNCLVAEGGKGLVFCLAENEFNINTVSDLEEAREFFMSREMGDNE